MRLWELPDDWRVGVTDLEVEPATATLPARCRLVVRGVVAQGVGPTPEAAERRALEDLAERLGGFVSERP